MALTLTLTMTMTLSMSMSDHDRDPDSAHNHDHDPDPDSPENIRLLQDQEVFSKLHTEAQELKNKILQLETEVKVSEPTITLTLVGPTMILKLTLNCPTTNFQATVGLSHGRPHHPCIVTKQTT